MGKVNVLSASNNRSASEWKEGNVVLNSLPKLKKSGTVAEDELLTSNRPKGCILICLPVKFEIGHYLQTLGKWSHIIEKQRQKEKQKDWEEFNR